MRIKRTAGGSGDAAMTQPAKAQEPSMEEILASIRRIIADDDSTKSPPKAAEAAPPSPSSPMPAPPPRPAPSPTPPPAPPKHVEIDAMLADLNAPPGLPA